MWELFKGLTTGTIGIRDFFLWDFNGFLGLVYMRVLTIVKHIKEVTFQ